MTRRTISKDLPRRHCCTKIISGKPAGVPRSESLGLFAKIAEKLLLASSCLSVCLSVCPRRKIQLPLDGFFKEI